MITLPAPVHYPVQQWISVTPADTGTTMSSSGHKIAWVFRVPPWLDGKAIRSFVIGTNTVTTGETVEISVQTVSASDGLPTGTLWDDPTNNCKASFAIADGDDNTYKATGDMTADATLATNQVVAIVLSNAGSGNMNIVHYYARSAFANSSYPCIYTSSWAIGTAGQMLFLAIKMSDGTYYEIPHILPFYNVATTAYSSTSTPDEIGNLIIPKFTCVITGVTIQIASSNTARDFKVQLYDSSDNVLATTSVDSNQIATTSAVMTFIPFTRTILTKNLTYRIGIVPTTTANNSIYYGQVSENSALDQVGGFGANMYKTTRTRTGDGDAGSWTETTTDQVLMGLCITEIGQIEPQYRTNGGA